MDGIETEDVRQCFNLAFSDYPFHFELSIEQLESKIIHEGIDFSISVGAFKESELIAFVIHAKKEKNGKLIAYNAGTGVIPSERGQALTRKMYKYILPHLKNLNFHKIMLEVLSGNMPAISSYEKIGFVLTRNFHCYGGDLKVDEVNEKIEIKSEDFFDLSTMKGSRETLPSWQNSDEAIHNAGRDVTYLTASIQNEILGYCAFNIHKKRILQLSVLKERRRQGIANALIALIKTHYFDSCTMINIEENCATLHPFLENVGLKATLYQHEMECLID